MAGGGGKRALSSTGVTIINLTKCFIGAASFELPWAVMQGGLIGSVAGIVVLALLSHFSLVRLALCGHLVHGDVTPTYPAVGAAAFGLIGKILAWSVHPLTTTT